MNASDIGNLNVYMYVKRSFSDFVTEWGQIELNPQKSFKSCTNMLYQKLFGAGCQIAVQIQLSFNTRQFVNSYAFIIWFDFTFLVACAISTRFYQTLVTQRFLTLFIKATVILIPWNPNYQSANASRSPTVYIFTMWVPKINTSMRKIPRFLYIFLIHVWFPAHKLSTFVLYFPLVCKSASLQFTFSRQR